MGQPIRKAVREAHPEVDIKPFYTLLVDGTNLLRIAFADKDKYNRNNIHYGAVYHFLRMVRDMMEKRPFDYVYVFFDDEDSGMLRYRIYKDYKANRDKNYGEHDGLSDYMKAVNDRIRQMQTYFSEKKKKKEKTPEEKFVDENFARERDILCRYFNELFVRWQMDEQTEGDDLISYYVHHKKPEEMIYIMSADEDLTQLIGDKVCIYNPRKKKAFSEKNFKKEKGFPHENVLLRKIFLGDTSDNIGNIRGVSEARLLELMPEITTRPVTVNEVIERAKQKCQERIDEKKKPLQWQENIVNGVANKNYDGDFYEINDKLINLDKPLLTKEAEEELSNMMYNAQDPEDRSFKNLYRYIIEDDIMELISDSAFSNFFLPFKELANKETERYKKQYS